jgi:Mor family transcriptional regulator
MNRKPPLTPEQISEIISRVDNESTDKLAREFKVSTGRIFEIWKQHLKTKTSNI